jgi:acetyl-CoA synthetase
MVYSGKILGGAMAGEVEAFIAARDLLLRHREDYDAAVRDFRWPALERFNWALDYFDRLPADDLALWLVGADEEKLTFGALRARSNQVASHLRALGVRRGDRVLLLLPNRRELWEAMLGLMKLGAVIVPATTLLAESDLRDRFERGGIRHAIVAAERAPRLAGLGGGYTKIAVGAAPGWNAFEDAYARAPDFSPEGETRADDPLLLYFTSGTTAKPKMVLHSQQSYPVGLLSTLYALGVRRGDLHLNISSPGWAKHAWSSLFAPWNAGAAVLALTDPRFDAKATLDILARCGVTTFCAPPTVWRVLVQQDLRQWRLSLREAVSAGEPLNPEIIAHVERVWGVTVRDFYGQTETTALVGNTPGAAITPGSMGRALPGYRIALLDEAGREADEGEISVALEPRPLGLMQGYRQDDGTLASVEGAYYRTGDTGTRAPDGRITYVGRSDDVFKSSDYRISPFELESALIEHEAVAEAAVVPSPDPRRMAVPKAYLVLAAGHAPDSGTARAIFAAMRDRLAPFKRVRRIEFAELPKTISGKIRRVELRQREAEQRRAGTRGAAEFWEEDFFEPGRAQ